MPTLFSFFVVHFVHRGLRRALGAASAVVTELHPASELIDGLFPHPGGRRPPRSCTNPATGPTLSNTGTGSETCDHSTEAMHHGTLP